MPEPFQRFIAGWELVVAWHREYWPKQTRDAELTAHLVQELPRLGLESNPEWLQRIAALVRWTVEEMSGAQATGRIHTVEGTGDWQGIVDALYTVRCNLLKGGKQPTNHADLALTKTAADVVFVVASKLIYREGAS